MRRVSFVTVFVLTLAGSCLADVASPTAIFVGSGAIAGFVLAVAIAAAGLWLARRNRTRSARVVWGLAAFLALLVGLGFLSGRNRDDERRYRDRDIREPVPAPAAK